jgi:hypothetical protein
VHSVSRTWSRHAPPDWTTHTRHVTRAEDIIINRDPSTLERGEAGLKGEEMSAFESKRASTSTAAPPSPDDVGEIGEGGSTETHAETVLEKDLEEGMKDTREEVPPDGTEKTTEWREGPHKIIERRDGPGGEVRRLIDDADVVVDLVYRSRSKLSTTHSSPRGKPHQDDQALRIFAIYITRLKKFIAAQKWSKRPSSMISMP